MKSGRDAHAPCVFCDAIPPVVEIEGGDSVGGGGAVASFDAVADGVVLVGAVAGGDAAVCAGDLTEGVVTPEPAGKGWEGLGRAGKGWEGLGRAG